MQKVLDFRDWRDKQGVYCIKNTANGKVYVGSAAYVYDGQRTARSLHIRLRDHVYALDRHQHANVHLQRAWDKYGKDSFEFYVLQEVSSGGDLLESEQTWIDQLKSADPQYGYNICKTAGSSLGRKHSPETKEKLRLLSTGRKHTPETRAKIGRAHV